ncbi:MAG: D-alanine--D-alanine ligase [Kiritimatiellae bacterium]|nr:D-alanine--D-alanine ligase [Kiritimatiellia bacterium]
MAVLKGGISSERDVSLRSGAAVARGLRALGCEAIEVDVTERRFTLPSAAEAVFVALHGMYGEDGGVQRELETMGIPYTGSGPESCRIAFDKGLTRAACASRGIPIPEGRIFHDPPAESPLPLPVVVKPTREGSSVGFTAVSTPDAWRAAARAALACHGEALVERFIPGREMTVGIVADQILPAVEIRAPGGCYDYTAKYTAGRTEYLCPAPVTTEVETALAVRAAETFEAVGARGFARVDFRVDPDGRLFVLELNSIPGFTETSLLPKAAAAVGLAFPELCGRILACAGRGG